MLPTGDHTPQDFKLPTVGFIERVIKRPIRRFAYPVYNYLINQRIQKIYQDKCDFFVNQWLWGQKGNDYERHRRRVNHLFPLKNKKMLLAGCGLSYDMPSWLIYPLKSLTGIDYFNYDRAWRMLTQEYGQHYPNVALNFQQNSLENLENIANDSFDLVASDAVFEHIKNLEVVLQEFHRILKPGGIVYATYGPLWYCWQGDHISGYDIIENGYNHLILEPEAYQQYIDGLGDYDHTPEDGRTWIQNELFSYLRPADYIKLLDKIGFSKLYTAVMVEPRAVQCLNQNPQLRENLLKKYHELDLIVGGMTIIYRKD